MFATDRTTACAPRSRSWTPSFSVVKITRPSCTSVPSTRMRTRQNPLAPEQLDSPEKEMNSVAVVLGGTVIDVDATSRKSVDDVCRKPQSPPQAQRRAPGSVTLEAPSALRVDRSLQSRRPRAALRPGCAGEASRATLARQRQLRLALMSTVWMVPFLMLADVTTIVAAVPLAAATTAATAAAMSAFFTFVSFPRH